MSKKFAALLIGAPGSGKGTVASRIINHFKIQHFAAGDILRSHVRNDTALGKEIGNRLTTGELLPSELINKIMLYELGLMQNACLLDGYPRTIEQAKALEATHALQTVVYLNIPFDIIINRLKSRWTHPPSGRVYNLGFNSPKREGFDDATGEPLVQRGDDKPETVKRRLDVFLKETAPLLEFYAARGLLHEFSGKTTNEIWPNILEHFKAKTPDHLHNTENNKLQN